MRREDADYRDVIDFLARVEDPSRASMNRRTRISDAEAATIRQRFPGVPDDFVAYLREVGRGNLRECQFKVYGCLGTPDDILGEGVFDWIEPGTRVLCFGDNYQGDLSGFLPDDGWAVVELWHDAGELYRTDQTFGQYIRDRMLMGPNG